MPTTSLLTIVKGRRFHLQNLLLGVRASGLKPAEVVVVFMNEDYPGDLPDPGCPLRTASYFDDEHALPLAAARNHAASLATGELLLFLDVDCIPGPDYVKQLVNAVAETRALVMGEVYYLPQQLSPDWTQTDLQRLGMTHPRRPDLGDAKHVKTDAYHLFWSLSFGLFKSDFARIGGFDESYVGYGGEDTDFAFTARSVDLPFYLSTARCYHQHHATCTPPYNHLEDIVTNARAFYGKWNRWPMEGWLDAFAASGHIKRTPDNLEIIRLPTELEVAQHRSTDPFA